MSITRPCLTPDKRIHEMPLSKEKCETEKYPWPIHASEGPTPTREDDTVTLLHLNNNIDFIF